MISTFLLKTKKKSFIRFFYWIVELFQHCRISCFSFYYIKWTRSKSDPVLFNAIFLWRTQFKVIYGTAPFPEQIDLTPGFLWGSCCSYRQITCFHVLSSVLWYTLQFPPRENDVRFVFTLIWCHVYFSFIFTCA